MSKSVGRSKTHNCTHIVKMRFKASPALFNQHPQEYKKMMISHKMSTSDISIATHIFLTPRICVHYGWCPKDLRIDSLNELIYTLLLATKEKENESD